MASYGVAATRNNFSALIDKALAGEDVIITRRGRQMVQILPYNGDSPKNSPSVGSEASRSK